MEGEPSLGSLPPPPDRYSRFLYRQMIMLNQSVRCTRARQIQNQDVSLVGSSVSAISAPPSYHEPSYAKRSSREVRQRSCHLNDKRTYNRLSSILTRPIRKYNKEQYNNYTQPLTTTHKSLWTTTRLQQSCHRLTMTDGTWTRIDKEKVDTFASYLHHIFSPDPNVKKQHIHIIKNKLNHSASHLLHKHFIHLT